MNINPYFSMSDLDQSHFYQMPKIFQIHHRYANLSPLAKICWTVLYEMQRNCMALGWVEKKSGNVYFHHLDFIINRFVINRFQKITPTQLIYELVEHHLLEVKILDETDLKRFYLLKPEHDVAELSSRQKEEFDFLINIKNMVKGSRKNKSVLLKEYIEEQGITDEFIINEMYREIIILGKNEEFDLLKIEEVYKRIVNQNPEPQNKSNPKAEANNMVTEAIQFMSPHLNASELAQLTNEDLIVLYKNFDKIDYLMKKNLFSLSLLLTIKTQYKLTSKDFSSLLDNALYLYDFNENNKVHFVHFFEKLISNREVVQKEQILINEITDKLFSLPNNLKQFVYQQMIKMSEHFPERYKLIIHNLRAINKIYEDMGGVALHEEVFKKAFRNLLIDKEIYNIVAYFRKGIEFASKDLSKQPKEDLPKEPTVTEIQEMDEKTWMELVVNAKETKGDIEKMNRQEREEYINKGEELRKRLEMLRTDN